MNRKTIKSIAALPARSRAGARRSFLLLVIVGCLHVIGVAQPSGIHLSRNGQKDVKTATSMGVTWCNDQKGEGLVQYGTDSSRLTQCQKATTTYSEGLSTYICKATLEHLKPATAYYYRVGSERTGWSPLYRFVTAPPTGSTRKVVVGIWSDTQNNAGNSNFEQTDTIVGQLQKHPFDFMLHNGDIIENGSVVKSWKAFFTTAQPLLARYPFMSVTGNHDVVNDTASPIFQKPFPVFYELFNLPGGQLNYSYDYANIHFVVINSGWAQGAEKLNKVFFAPHSAEAQWLEKDLAKARKNRATPWVIVYCHYPVFSFGFSHVETWGRHLQPILDKYNVDLLLSGHRHVYERHKAVRGPVIVDQQELHSYVRPQGTVYITNGSAGGSLQGLGGNELLTMVFTPKAKYYTYAVMTVEGARLSYEVYNKQGEKIDYFTINKEATTGAARVF
jgi:acid phosphatase type 7